MKIEFNTDDADYEYEPLVFNTADEWNAHKVILYNYTPRYAPDSSPNKFPCIALPNGYHDDPYGPYRQHYAFIYDFKIID